MVRSAVRRVSNHEGVEPRGRHAPKNAPSCFETRASLALSMRELAPPEFVATALSPQIAIDKITVVPVAKIGEVIGQADDALLLRVNRALALFLGIV